MQSQLVTLLVVFAAALCSNSVMAQSEDRHAILKKPRIKETSVSHGMEQSFEIDLPMRRLTPSCKGQVELEYDQYDTVARVETRLGSTTCPVTYVQYALIVSSRDADYEIVTSRHEFAWDVTPDGTLPGSGDYPIGDDTDLVSVRARQFSCTCADDTDAADGDTPEALPSDDAGG